MVDKEYPWDDDDDDVCDDDLRDDDDVCGDDDDIKDDGGASSIGALPLPVLVVAVATAIGGVSKGGLCWTLWQ